MPTTRLLSRTALFAAVLGAGSCSPAQEPGVAWAPEVTALATPAGEGSGEAFLSTFGDTVLLSWLEPAEGDGYALRLARLTDGGWSEPLTVRTSDRFFVNWADFPSVVPDRAGRLWVHWLERGEGGGYDYGVRLARSEDGGATWSEPWAPHEDGTATEHGFVSMLPLEDGIGLSWLDGREYALPGPGGGDPPREMTVRFRRVAGDGTPGPEEVLDGRSCDCCQTDAALAQAGPVVVYRDRSEEEIRDIYITRWVDGAWTPGAPVHDDGWHIAGCPVNGPAVVADGARVAVAWFTAANDEPRVKVAFSDDGGATFGAPVAVDEGNPGGRVDLLALEDGAVLVSWQERTGQEGAEVRIRRVAPDGSATPSAPVAATGAARASGFPRMVHAGDGTVVVAWTDTGGRETRVQLARVTLEGS